MLRRNAKQLLALSLLVCTAPPLAGQESTTRGLNLGFHLQAASLSVQDGESDGGAGAGFRIGYGINRIVTLYFELDGISVDSEGSDDFQGTWSLAHTDLGARFHFASTLRSWVPYLEVAVGGRAATVSNARSEGTEVGDINFLGGSFSFGGGIYYYFTETFGLDVSLKLTGGEFDEVDLGPILLDDLDIDASSTRFKVGIVWWP
ncbi:MAG: outer membrane beta-barrel protein [Gemmatimonadota bacterium]|jgi:hypothetical protein